MHYRKNSDCNHCDKCIDEPGKLNCNIACKSTEKNCYESYKVFNPGIYAKATIVLQPYEHLFDLDDGFKAGTIFKDLYSPYCDVKYIKECKRYE